jgi:hypothetical protein
MNGTILPFKGVHQYCKYWDKELQKAIDSNTEYSNGIDFRINDTTRSLSQGDSVSNRIAYGFPVPTSYQDAMDRKMFLNMELYNNTYEELQPLLANLEKISQGLIPKEVIRPTDLEIGVFSFDRAAMMLEPVPALYCNKNDTFYDMSKGVEVLDSKGEHKKTTLVNKETKVKEEFLLYKITENGYDAILTQLEEDGVAMFTSSNKKSFLRKEKLPKPDRLVRLFVLTGAIWGNPTYYSGLSAIITAIYLESRGYSVRITGVLGVETDILYKGEVQRGARFSMIDLKAYDETMDSLSLLYVLADSSFFRVRQFNYYLAQQYKFQDPFNSSLGYMPSATTFKSMLFDKIKEKEVASEKDVLYYFFGGTEITNLEQARNEIISIICNAETHNKEALQRLGYEMPTTDNNVPRNVGDIECP